MSQKLDFKLLQALYTDVRFESMVRALDKLHDAASEGHTEDLTPLPRHEMIGWLREIAYLAEETIQELEQTDSARKQDGGQLRLHVLMRERTAAHAKTGRGGRGN